ncbi:MAG TPA: GNAT family N-acetyltransferase [Rhizomicrobium sp.]
MIIRPAKPGDYDELAQIWLESWYSTDLKSLFDPGLEMLRKRIPEEIAKGWDLYAAEEDGELVALLALNPSDFYLDQLWVAPSHQGRGIGRKLLDFTRAKFPDEIWLRCVVENARAWAWYEREGFQFEGEENVPPSNMRMRRYRWTRSR